MRRFYLLFLILLLDIPYVYALKPSKVYSLTPDRFNLKYEAIKVKTCDDAIINVWHLTSDSLSMPIIISQSDAGNMSNWIYLGLYLQAFGYDVWMYDYRGFGESSDFQMQQSQLFYEEFVTDLSSVAEYVYKRTSRTPVLMGLSMGTIIVNEYLKNTSIPIELLIFDGCVINPPEYIERLKQLGKIVSLPDNYEYRQYTNSDKYILYFVAEKDRYSIIEDIPAKDSPNVFIQKFNCDHLASFSSYPQQYLDAIYSFTSSYEHKAEKVCINTNN